MSQTATKKPATPFGIPASELEKLRETAFSDPDSERRFWGKILLKKWLALYLALWIFLTVALAVENDPLRSAALAMILAFGGSTLITVFLGAALALQARRHLGTISAEEKLVALVFAMALCALYPFCWYFRLGWSVALSLTLLVYQALVMLSRHSKFSEKLLGGDTPKLFPESNE